MPQSVLSQELELQTEAITFQATKTSFGGLLLREFQWGFFFFLNGMWKEVFLDDLMGGLFIHLLELFECWGCSPIFPFVL